MPVPPATLDAIAADLLSHFGDGQELGRTTDRYPDFTLDDGYAVAHRIRDLRRARGETPVGRKIGGTNPAIYHLTGATGPSWGFMYDSTVHALLDGEGSFALGAFRQPRIEPELVLHLCAAPKAGMDETALLGCVDRVAHGFEIVHSPFSDWKVRPPDAVASFGMHQALLIGPWHDVSDDRAAWGQTLKNFTVSLRNGADIERHGTGANALGTPVLALGAIVEDIARHPDWTPLAAGEIVTTGTLTELMPVAPGDVWTTTIGGPPLTGLRVSFT
ncbi:MAG: hydratase [Devosia sp.]